MVRFIIDESYYEKDEKERIYIPIWLDLLFDLSQEHVFTAEAFTFQYG